MVAQIVEAQPAVELLTLLMSAPHFSLRQVFAGFCSSLQAGQVISRVRLRHAERQPLMGFVGSGFE
jgi:hypothetical protein